MPKINAVPISNKPSINSQSTNAEPANAPKYFPKNPVAPNLRNPAVGEIPASHVLSAAVLNPRPKTLSKNAHNKIQPKLILKNAPNYFIFSWDFSNFFFRY